MLSSLQTNLTFDFEESQEFRSMLPALEAVTTQQANIDKKNFKTVMCVHWLQGLCNKRSECKHLHQIDKNKAPLCKHGKLCKIKNCLLKHLDEQDILECIYFKQGFCFNGPECKRRHIKRSPDECPLEASFDQAGGGILNPLFNKKIKSSQRNENYKTTLCSHWLDHGGECLRPECHFAHGEAEICESMLQTNDMFNDFNIHDPTRHVLDISPNIELPFLPTARVTYFLAHAPDLRSLVISRRRGTWSVAQRVAAEVNAAFRTSEHALLFFCVRPLKGIYGIARVSGPIPPSMDPSYPITPEFPVQWLRTFRLSLRSIAQLKINQTGMFIGRTFGDSKFDDKTGYSILKIFYRKQPWDWAQQLQKAEENMIREAEETASIANLSPDILFSESWIEKVAQTNMSLAGRAVTTERAMSSSNDFYKNSFPGYVFVCTGPIIEEMFMKSLFGLPASMKDVVIHMDAPLFLFDPRERLLHGMFKALSLLTENLDPTAFLNWQLGPAAAAAGSLLPLQVHFDVVLDCSQTPIHVDKDQEFRSIFLPNQKFVGGALGLKETKAIANLFAKRAGIQLGGRGQAADNIQHTTGYKPPFKNVESIIIGINANPNDVVSRLLGTGCSIINQIANDVTGGNPNAVKIRSRGIGSRYGEGPDKIELQEPLQFCVSAESDEVLKKAVARVHELIAKVRKDLTGQ